MILTKKLENLRDGALVTTKKNGKSQRSQTFGLPIIITSFYSDTKSEFKHFPLVNISSLFPGLLDSQNQLDYFGIYPMWER